MNYENIVIRALESSFDEFLCRYIKILCGFRNRT